MDQSFEAEAHPKLFEFIDEKTALSPNTGLLLAAEDLLRLAGHFPGSKGPTGWRKRVDGFGKGTEDRKYTLRVFKMKDFWIVTRRTSRRLLDFEYLALVFDKVPLCTRTDQEAMRLADHCHPDPGQTIPGCWVPYLQR